MIKYKVTLTSDERQLLEKLVSAGQSTARKLTHARVLLLADEGEHGPGRTNASIVAALGIGERTVERIRKRFVTESFEAALNPRPQPRRPDKVKIQGPWSNNWCNWLAVILRVDAVAGRCSCWPTKWSFSGTWTGSRPRPSARR